MRLKKIFFEGLLIFGVSVLLGFGVNFSLVKKFFKGEFAHGFYRAEKYPHISFIVLGEAEDLFNTGQVVFIDSRPGEAFRSGHILGAVNIPFETRKGELSVERFGLAPEETLVVYCDGSECQSSVELAKLFHEQGFRDIKVFFGGWQEWAAAGLPVEGKRE